MQALLEMLKHDCGSNMNLSAAADKLGLSSVYLSKVFKRVTGVNYTQYLTDARMEARQGAAAGLITRRYRRLPSRWDTARDIISARYSSSIPDCRPANICSKKRMEG